MTVHLAEFAFALSAFDDFKKPLRDGHEILSRQAFDAGGTREHQALEQHRVIAAAADKIEMGFHKPQQDGPGRRFRRQRLGRAALELFEIGFQDRQKQQVLALEVVIEHGLVDAGGGGDTVRARAIQAGFGEDASCRRKNRVARRIGAALTG